MLLVAGWKLQVQMTSNMRTWNMPDILCLRDTEGVCAAPLPYKAVDDEPELINTECSNVPSP